MAAPHSEEDTALSGENEEDIQMNETRNENVPEIHIPSEVHAVVQQVSCRQSNQDECKQRLVVK